VLSTWFGPERSYSWPSASFSSTFTIFSSASNLPLPQDGVAPRAKMNQQRSRRFRTAQEAHEKEEARKESVALWECEPTPYFMLSSLHCYLRPAMGKTISDDEKNKKAWDSNAITPGTPFMELLAKSLRYWVVQKLNSDPGWKQVGHTYFSCLL
jgi:5'-3' exoribonuclease 2